MDDFNREKNTKEKGNVGWAVLGFFVPIVGLLLYLVWQNDKPLDSKMAGKGALIGVIVSASLSVLITILGTIFMSGMWEFIFDIMKDVPSV